MPAYFHLLGKPELFFQCGALGVTRFRRIAPASGYLATNVCGVASPVNTSFSFSYLNAINTAANFCSNLS